MADQVVPAIRRPDRRKSVARGGAIQIGDCLLPLAMLGEQVSTVDVGCWVRGPFSNTPVRVFDAIVYSRVGVGRQGVKKAQKKQTQCFDKSGHFA